MRNPLAVGTRHASTMKPMRACVGIVVAALVALGLGAPSTGAVSSGPRCPTGGKGLLRTASLRAYSVGTVRAGVSVLFGPTVRAHWRG